MSVAPHGLHSNRAPAARAGEEEGASFQRTGRSPAPCSSVATRELGRPHSASNAEGHRARAAWTRRRVGVGRPLDAVRPLDADAPPAGGALEGGADGSASVEVEGSPPSTLGLGGHVAGSMRTLRLEASWRPLTFAAV